MVTVNYGPTELKGLKTFVLGNNKYGLQGVKATNIYAVDFNGDGYTDIVTLPEHFSNPHFYQYSKIENKYVRTKYDPFKEKNYCSFLAFADFNKDGVYDLVMGTLNQKTELSKHPIRIFKGKVTEGKISYHELVGSIPNQIFPTTSLAVIDFDLDGYLDLYLGNWYDFTKKNRKVAPDVLLKGKGFIFKNVSTILGNETRYVKASKSYPNARPTMGVSTCDLDQNGYPDFLTAVSSGYGNKLWMNYFHKKAVRIFEEQGAVSHYGNDSEGDLDPRGGGNTFFSACTDYNNDGFMDVVIGELSHSYDNESRDRSSILTGNGNKKPLNFIRSEYYMDDGTVGWSQADRRGGWFDYNLDGLIDLFIVNSGFPPKSRLIVFEQSEDHSFHDVAKKLGVDIVNPSGTVVVDLNRDGLLDIATGQTHVRDASINDQLYVFENAIKTGGKRSLRFYPRGRRSNYHALGAMLVLKSKKRTQKRWVEYSSGPFPSQNEEGIVFGIDKDDIPIELMIRWPILSKSGRPLVKKYSLDKLKFNSYVQVTACESGRLIYKFNGDCSTK